MVIMPNAIVEVLNRATRAAIVPYDGAVLNANMQKTSMKNPSAVLTSIGDGLPEFRIRVDLPVSGNLPSQGDLVIVHHHANSPHLTGRWNLLAMDSDTGDMASGILYVERDNVNQ
jgi:hypothetical protein